MLKIAICDDSTIDIELIESIFQDLPQYPVDYDVFFSAKELLEHRKKSKEMYHLYIFDIEMPDMNGLTLAEKIRKEDMKALFVFLTSHTQYVMEAFEVITFHYLSKPITEEKLGGILEKVMNYLKITKQDFVFQYRKNHFRVSCEDIIYIEKKGRQAIIHTDTERFKTNMTTDEIWEQLDTTVFAPIHISYIVNLKHIKAIEKEDVILDNGKVFAIARSHKQELKEKHLNYMKGIM